MAGRVLLLGVALGAFLTGCVESNEVVCDDGSICPAGNVCVTVAGTPFCATEAQVTACAGQADGTTCTMTNDGDGSCHDGVCALVSCGNGLVDPGETCDDGNNNSGDLCSADCQSTEACGNGVLDPVVIVNGVAQLNESCDDGNLMSHDGCSSRCQPEAMAWTDISLRGVPRRGRAGLVFDTVRQRFVLFGGEDGSGNQVSYDETWESADGISWRRIMTAVAPPPRTGPGMAYDPVRRRTVLFGGGGVGNLGLADTWEWDGHRWYDVTTPSGPSARSSTAMAYDPSRKAVVLWGGGDVDETWAWDGTTWTQLPISGPTPRITQSFAYDPVRGELVLSPGESAPADTWELDASGWHQREVDGGSTALGDFVTLGYDPGSQQVIAFQNRVSDGGSPFMFSWNGATWTPVSTNTPIRETGALAADPAHNVMVMVDVLTDYATQEKYIAEAWRYQDGTWTKPTAPSHLTFGEPYFGAYATQSRTEVLVTDSYTVELANDSWSVWPLPTFTGYAMFMAYDSARDEVVLFGNTQSSSTTQVYSQHAWVTRSTPAPPAKGMDMAYDAAHGKTVLLADSGVGTTDTWLWDGTTWTQAPVVGETPLPRTEAAFACDPIRGQCVLFAGRYTIPGTEFTTYYSDTWVWDGTSWHEAHPQRPPPKRTGASIVWNPARKAIDMIGGYSTQGLGDTWEWDGTEWVPLDVVLPARSGAFAFPADDQEAIRVYGGYAGVSIYNLAVTDEIWELRFDDMAADERCEIVVDADGDKLAGCADPDCFATCDPTCPPGMSCSTPRPTCGDGTCQVSFETCHSCPTDCTACTTVACGDNFCDPSETMANCPGDCTP